jgi:hypothetical protein
VVQAEHVANKDGDAAIERARKADSAGGAASCNQALIEARRLYLIKDWAEAQNYPWCSIYTGGSSNCGSDLQTVHGQRQWDWRVLSGKRHVQADRTRFRSA